MGAAVMDEWSELSPGEPAPTTVLVVDDEAIVRDIVVRYLEREGFRGVAAEDGLRAQEAMVAYDPALIILDVMLPELDGLDLCRSIRETSDVPVIFLTALGEEDDRLAGLELGADDYVVKPFSPRELMHRVKAILRRSLPPKEAAPSQITVGGLAIDVLAREVVRDGQTVELTATEFDLLWCLASCPREVFSRQQLLAQVWGYTAALDAGTSTVTVHIRRLREKVERNPSQPELITTVWGVGYRFEP